MIVLVCGGRDFTDQKAVNEALSNLHHISAFTLLVQGGARGADRLAFTWAVDNKIAVKTFRADWDMYGRAAGEQGPWA